MNRKLYRVWSRFEPDHINLPAGRRGQWRVMECYETRFTKQAVKVDVIDITVGVLSTKPYNRGSIICPHKALKQVLAARRSDTPACPKHTTGGGPCYCPGSIYQPHQ
jgi:hypothetical protein